jgi:hypothetical protein
VIGHRVPIPRLAFHGLAQSGSSMRSRVCGPTAEAPPLADDESTPQVCRRMRSIAPTATPSTAATWPAVMPYSVQTRMRANCERGISVVIRSSEMVGASPCSRQTGAGGNALRILGFRADGSAGGTEAGTGCSVTCLFGVKSASAA